MKGTKTQKGITLVALIITIVVLLILAVVAITEIGETGIIAKAEDSASKYNASVKNEANMLANLLGYLNEVTACDHSYDSDGKCTKCPAICPHTWDSNGNECTTCSFTCTHEYVNGICNKEGCGYNRAAVCEHSWDNWEGKCTNCNLECTHPQKDNYCYCLTCGYWNHGSTSYEYGVQYADDASHSVNEVCVDCGSDPWAASWPESHNYVNGVCTVCNHVCEHRGEFTDGKCSYNCGFECSHPQDQVLYDPAYRTDAQTHYQDIICGVCGYKISVYEEAHYHNAPPTYHAEGDVCVETGWCICGESFASGRGAHNWDPTTGCCMQCWTSHSPHTYDAYGYCVECGYLGVCDHSDSLGRWTCYECGERIDYNGCEHKNTYMDGATEVCNDCGAANY